MTSHQAQLQALITEIESLLGKATPRLPWVMAGETGQQRRLLEQALAHLKEFQETGRLPADWGGFSGDAPLVPSTELPADISTNTEVASQQVLQALLQEMQYLRAQMIQPLTHEVMALQQQREQLKNEVRQLELERLQQGSQEATSQRNPAWVSEVVEQLRSSLMAQLTPQFKALQAQVNDAPALYDSPQDPQEVAADLPQLHPQQRLEQLRQIQGQTDYLLLKLDSNLRAIFESMEQSIQSYCDSLTQGLDSMHGLGQQGEVIFGAFINHLAQQLGQESGYLSSAGEEVARLPEGDATAYKAYDESPLAADESPIEEPLPDSVVNLDDIDLDTDLSEGEEITLFQLDEEITQLDLDDDADSADLEADDDTIGLSEGENTLIQTEPIPWEVAIGRRPPDVAAAADTPADETDSDETSPEYDEEIDALYESLFGEPDETGAEAPPASAETPDPVADEMAVSEEPFDEALDESLLAVENFFLEEDVSEAAVTPSDLDVPLLDVPADMGLADMGADIGAPEGAIAPPPLELADPSLENLIETPDSSAAADAPEEDAEDSPGLDDSLIAASEDNAETTLETFLGSEVAEELAPPEMSSLESDTISSLSDLLPASESEETPRSTDPSATLEETSEDTFIPAPPDEDLLTSEVEESVWDVDLSLDDTALEQLTTDLSRLEGLPSDSMELGTALDLEVPLEEEPSVVEGGVEEDPESSIQAFFSEPEPSETATESAPVDSIQEFFSESDATEPDVPGPEVAELDVAELDVAELDVAELDVTDLDVTDLDVAEPEATESDAAASEETLPSTAAELIAMVESEVFPEALFPTEDAAERPEEDAAEPLSLAEESALSDAADDEPIEPEQATLESVFDGPIEPEQADSESAFSFEGFSEDLFQETDTEAVSFSIDEAFETDFSSDALETDLSRDVFETDLESVAAVTPDDFASQNDEESQDEEPQVASEPVVPADFEEMIAAELPADASPEPASIASEDALEEADVLDADALEADVDVLEDAFSLSLEDVSLDLELPDLQETDPSPEVADSAVEDDLAIALSDTFPELSLAEDVLPTEPPADAESLAEDDEVSPDLPLDDDIAELTTAATDPDVDSPETFTDLSLSLEDISLELALPEDSDIAAFSEDEEEATTPTELMAEFDNPDFVDERLPASPEVAAEASSATAAAAADMELDAFPLGDLDLDLSLDSDPEADDPSAAAGFLEDLDLEMPPLSEAPASLEDLSTLEDLDLSTEDSEPASAASAQPERSLFNVAGSVTEGFSVSIDETAFNQYLEGALTETPESQQDVREIRSESEPDDAVSPEAEVESPDLSPPTVEIVGSYDEGFNLSTPQDASVTDNSALESALADLPDASEDDLLSELSAQSSVVDDPSGPLFVSPTPEDLSAQAEASSPSEAELAELFSAEALAFGTDAELILPDIPDFDERETFLPESPPEPLDAVADPSAESSDIEAEASAPGLGLTGAVETGFNVVLDETAWALPSEAEPIDLSDLEHPSDLDIPESEDSPEESVTDILDAAAIDSHESEDSVADILDAAAAELPEGDLNSMPPPPDEMSIEEGLGADGLLSDAFSATAEEAAIGEFDFGSEDTDDLDETAAGPLSEAELTELFPPTFEEPEASAETDLDLSMEEIPEIEIENDEAFRSAFQEEASSTRQEASPSPMAERSTDLPGLDDLFDAADEEILEASFGEATTPAEEDVALEADMFSLADLEDADVTAAGDEASSASPLSPSESEQAAAAADFLLLDDLSLDDAVEPEAVAAREETPPAPAVTAPDAESGATPGAPLETSNVLATVADDEIPAGEAPPLSSLPSEEEWFLGLDVGTSGLSAVLMDRVSGAAHPLYWSERASASGADTTFRLPAVVALKAGAQSAQSLWQLQAVGTAALAEGAADFNTWLLSTLKPLLKVGIPYSTDSGEWEPIIEWADNQTLPLQQILTGLQALVSLVRQSTGTRVELGAAGLETAQLHHALDHLQGVIVGHPSGWSDTYCINMREVILAARLIEEPSQVFFVEEAIAAILSGLPDPNDPPPEQNRQVQTLYQCNWQGGTVVISAGASCTELGIVALPYPLDTLSREDITLRNLPYGGDALDLDLICQLLLPPERRQPRAPDSRQSQTPGWSWHPTLPDVTDARWESLGLDALDLPQLAEPDESTRIHFRQHLEASRLGQSLLEAARYLKLILQNQSQFQLELADQSWRVLRRDLESRVLVPYIQRLNQHLNALLSTTGLSSQGINQVICTGGNVSFATIAKWLRQKFPNATIIQDTYPSNRPPSCSRVAYGLVNLCRYPQVLDVPQHQYSDYFLLNELVQTMPDQPLPLKGILHLLEERGVNVDVCQSRIVALLEGHLPPGLVPDATARAYLSSATLNSDTYAGLSASTVFTRQSGQIYMLNPQQRDLIRTSLATRLANKHQALSEPLIAQLVMP
ncbi:MAG: hypothetical protein F6J95_004435 [Leptolyngbya sp. SIO1E4]|nr:hypothetical protein [Leptolyngbya sp. SIO1E4]